jgi:hypothetical protein
MMMDVVGDYEKDGGARGLTLKGDEDIFSSSL